jgi:hypothetical protein
LQPCHNARLDNKLVNQFAGATAVRLAVEPLRHQQRIVRSGRDIPHSLLEEITRGRSPDLQVKNGIQCGLLDGITRHAPARTLLAVPRNLVGTFLVASAPENHSHLSCDLFI